MSFSNPFKSLAALTRAVLIAAVLGLFAGAVPTPLAADDRPLRFNRDIRGLLTDRCLACHGPDAETLHAGLRLDLREEAVETMGVIVPGDSDSSELVRRILSEDPGEIMPPPEMHKPLSPEEIDLLQRWIDQGAEYEPHWAYVPMQWPADFPRSEWTKTPDLIDALIEQRLAEEEVSPQPLADPITLIRRLSLDLTGLPPTPQEVDAFLQDPSPEAYEKVVDRLLDSPRFGERMAIYWLDLVRYADTVGYHGDQNISQSPYRDYVISAFNRNLPYDRFIREQLAGDLLPDRTLEQLVASGYNRLNQTTEEGGSQAKEYLAIYLADRVRNVSQVFMGATVGCAQCHDHKFDPYTAKDFYSLGAFFADLEEVGVYSDRGRPPMVRVPTPELEAELAQWDAKIAELEAESAAVSQQLLAKQAEWEASAKDRIGESREVEVAWVDDTHGLVGPNKQDAAWKYITADQGPVHRGGRSRKQQSDSLVQHLFLGVDTKHTVTPDTRLFAWVYLDPDNPPQALMLQFNDGSWEHRKVWGGDQITYGRTPENRPAYQRAGDLPSTGQWVRLEAAAAEVGLEPGAKINGMAFTQYGGLAYWDQAGLLVQEGFPGDVAQALAIAPDQRDEAQQRAVRQYYLDSAEEMVAQRNQIQIAKDQRQASYDSAPTTVVSKSVQPRTIRILPRGDWMDDSGPIVQPAIPQFLGELETEGRATRLDLADWLCQPDHPLTARTMVNRLWSLLFGRGICSSLDDFGGQGTYPSHPELLDALSIRFVESGWDIKAIMREMVLSQTYRRASQPSPELRSRDPYNEWFARQGRFGLLAEVVRDSALAVSGLLVEKIGGPSAHPYQPAGYYKELNFPRREYQADMDENQYRRGVYTHWQRTFLHPMLKAFDAPSREECTAQRSRSNTPLQALVLLNDPSFVEAARVFAARIIREGGQDPQQRIRWAYRHAVSRIPSSEIVDELLAVYESQRQHYEANVAEAQALISVGNAPTASDLSAAELAAWTGVARVILNLHETITRY